MKARIRTFTVLVSLGLAPCLLICSRQSRAVTEDVPQAEAKPAAAAAGAKRALLVGCTRYANLPPASQLEGPANDVVLMRMVLMEHFGFPDQAIMTLSEEAGKARGEAFRPTRENIERAFKRLARDAKPGDQVVILLSGHGAQQPEPNPPPDPDNVEPDGLDETFLPADCGSWEQKHYGVANAIVDDQTARLDAGHPQGRGLAVVHRGLLPFGNLAARLGGRAHGCDEGTGNPP